VTAPEEFASQQIGGAERSGQGKLFKMMTERIGVAEKLSCVFSECCDLSRIVHSLPT
jgi:hypothetical protein